MTKLVCFPMFSAASICATFALSFPPLGLILNGVYIKTQGQNLKPGCQSSMSCGNCGTGSCSKDWDGKTCRCQKGFTGPNCIDVCGLNPCLNEGLCKRSSTALHGFTCNCKPSFTGTYPRIVWFSIVSSCFTIYYQRTLLIYHSNLRLQIPYWGLRLANAKLRRKKAVL